MSEWAPPAWAESWDRVGLQVGDPAAPVTRIMAALEVTDEVLAEAEAAGAELLVVHHPLIFRPLSSVRLDQPAGRILRRLWQSNLAVYVAHTNLDVAPGGTNDCLAALIGLDQTQILKPAAETALLKLITFVPPAHADAVRDALAAAGAGRIGNYSHCTFQSPGTGTYRPLPGASPFAGRIGTLARESEVRLEVQVEAGGVAAAVAALKATHPYEEVAYDLIPLANPGPKRGHGRIGLLPAPITVAELAGRVQSALAVSWLRLAGRADAIVQTVACAAGSGGSFVPDAITGGAEVLISGDLDHHDVQDALGAGMAALDPGHFATEQPVVAAMVERLQTAFNERNQPVKVMASHRSRGPFTVLVAGAPQV